jgi:hypothetical protein
MTQSKDLENIKEDFKLYFLENSDTVSNVRGVAFNALRFSKAWNFIEQTIKSRDQEIKKNILVRRKKMKNKDLNKIEKKFENEERKSIYDKLIEFCRYPGCPSVADECRSDELLSMLSDEEEKK